jgi:peptidoglycan/LPS O-acetylase OafA/YrhL
MKTIKDQNFRSEIAGLRALAILPVLFFHAGFGFAAGGFFGVDVFFVISGYLITKTIIHDVNLDRFSITEFYNRRIKRIVPTLLCVCIFSIPFAAVTMNPIQLKSFSNSLLTAPVFMSNILFWREVGYFDQSSNLKPLLHTWSLSVEGQFYLMAPLLALSIKFFRNSYAYYIIAIFLISFSLAVFCTTLYPTATFYLFPTRVWEFAVGMVTYVLMKQRQRPASSILAFIGLLCVIGSFFGPFQPNSAFFTLVPVFGAAMIISNAASSNLVGKILSNRILVGVGTISYSLYLWHNPIFSYARLFNPEPIGTITIWCLLLCCFLVSILSFTFIESSKTIKTSIVLIFAVALIFTTSFVGKFIITNDQFFTKTVVGEVGHETTRKYLLDNFNNIESIMASEALKNSEMISVQNRQGEPDTILLGDSHAEHLYIGLEKEHQGNIAVYALSEALTLKNSISKTIISEIILSETVKTVFIAQHYALRLKEYEDFYVELSEVVNSLRTADINVYLLVDIPLFPIDAAHCAYRSRFQRLSGQCVISAYDAGLQVIKYKSVLDTLAQKPGVYVLDPTSVICNELTCSMVSGNNLYYRDNNHLNILGSLIVGTKIRAELENGNGPDFKFK